MRGSTGAGHPADNDADCKRNQKKPDVLLNEIPHGVSFPVAARLLDDLEFNTAVRGLPFGIVVRCNWRTLAVALGAKPADFHAATT